ncbi:protein spaetzle 4-like [Varroa jacobsoni]|uniref:Spaetzle domain-containing protein n=1 Tax=Varroa destructor TaxID=109461 RepID=A0A7M7IYQ7_VARDE|nr:protein spaetzle 4-like isoform X2 [Varroa destructor]XP_022689822.1 protein spaetzle 4-like [Varroa jacobsoni]
MLLSQIMLSFQAVWYFTVLVVCSLIYTVVGRSQMSCGSRLGARAFVHPPCDLSRRSFCVEPGDSYPWKAVRRYIYENQGLMRRMYGDQRQGELLTQEVVQERKRFDSSARSGRLLQILNEHDIQDLQNIDELRALVQRAGHFGEHENLMNGQQATIEPRRSVRFNSRYSSFDDPLSVPVTEDGADSELLPSSPTPPDQNTQRHSLQSQPDPPQENVSSKSRGNYNAQETSNADFGMAVEEAELNNDHVEKGVTIPQVETTSMIAETMQTGPNPTTQRAPIGLSNIAVAANLEVSSEGSVSVMASGRPPGTNQKPGSLLEINEPSVTTKPLEGATVWTTIPMKSSTTELPEVLAMYTPHTDDERQPDDELPFSSIDVPLDAKRLGESNKISEDDSATLRTSPTADITTPTSITPTKVTNDSSWSSINEQNATKSSIEPLKASVSSNTVPSRRRPPPILDVPRPMPTEEDQSTADQIKGIAACPTNEEVVSPYWANNTRGEVLALLNVHPFEQYIHSETCAFNKEQMLCRRGCRCEQQFRLHRLLAFDPHDDCRGVFSDWFRFPAGCVCVCYDLFGLSALFKL